MPRAISRTALFVLAALATSCADGPPRSIEPTQPASSSSTEAPPEPPWALEPTAVISIGSGAGAIIAAGSMVWVGTETGVVRVDPATDTAAQVVEGLEPPFGLNIGFGSAWISLADEADPKGWVERYDLATGELQATIDVGLMPLETLTAFESIWVPNHHSASVSRIDPLTNAVTATIEIGDGTGDPYGLAAGDRLVWVTSPNWGRASGIDPDRNHVVDEAEVQACAVRALEGRIWVDDCVTGRPLVSIFAEDEAFHVEHLDAPPAGLPLSDGTLSWTAALSTDASTLVITALDAETGQLGESLDTGIVEPAAWTIGFGALWVTTSQEVRRYDLNLLPQ